MAKKKLTNLLSGVKKHKVATFLYIIFLISLSVFLYGRYIDYRNVQDMKQLLADLQQLERDMEAETGEKFYIEADCGSGGDFASFYSCSVVLKPESNVWSTKFLNIIALNETKTLQEFGKCKMLSERSIGIEPHEDYYICSFLVNNSNKNKAEEIFYPYDTSPGSPF